MKVIMDLPRDWEVKSCDMSKGQIVLEPRFVGTARSAHILFLQAKGEGGQEQRAILTVSGNTGAFNTVKLKESQTLMTFDEEKEIVPEPPRRPTASRQPTRPTAPAATPPAPQPGSAVD